jgi:peroxiredoxin
MNNMIHRATMRTARYILVITVLLTGGLVLAQSDGISIGEDEIGLSVGTSAPDFTGETYRGNALTLSDLYNNGPVVLVFYRGAWCPYCNVHLRAFQNNIEKFRDLGASIVAVSVDKPQYATKTVSDEALDFEVISDPGAEILERYNVVFRVPEHLAEKYLQEYNIDLEAHSGRSDHVIAFPASYVIDEDGTIIFADVNLDYKVRTDPDALLRFLIDRKP